MYADRYGNAGGLKPGSMSLALGSVALIVVGLSFTAPHFTRRPDSPFIGRNIPLDPPPKPKPVDEKRVLRQQPALPTPRHENPDITHPPVPTNPTEGSIFRTDPPPVVGELDGIGAGAGVRTEPVHVPVLIGARLDQHYAASFQPVYPPDERRAEREGHVVVKVLIGVDGRVKQVERVSAASDSFFAVTRDRALGKWRFTPATRDGVPVESWQTMNVSFVLHDD